MSKETMMIFNNSNYNFYPHLAQTRDHQGDLAWKGRHVALLSHLIATRGSSEMCVQFFLLFLHIFSESIC